MVTTTPIKEDDEYVGVRVRLKETSVRALILPQIDIVSSEIMLTAPQSISYPIKGSPPFRNELEVPQRAHLMR